MAAVVVAMVAARVGVVAAPSAAEPALAPGACNSGECCRPIPDVIFGFLITLIACTLAFWGLFKFTASTTVEKTKLVLLAMFVPIYGLRAYILASFQNAMMMWKYQVLTRKYEVLTDPPNEEFSRGSRIRKLRSWLSPFSKFQGRILFWCKVVVYVEKTSRIPMESLLWVEKGSVKDESEAMVIGEELEGQTKEVHYERHEVSCEGIMTLLMSGVVPAYEELKFLRGNSGFAVLVIGLQAAGYIYAVSFRALQDLPVAPIEVIGLILNITLMIQVCAFVIFNPCHRPLVIYLNSAREERLLETLAKMQRHLSILVVDTTKDPSIFTEERSIPLVATTEERSTSLAATREERNMSLLVGMEEQIIPVVEIMEEQIIREVEIMEEISTPLEVIMEERRIPPIATTERQIIPLDWIEKETNVVEEPSIPLEWIEKVTNVVISVIYLGFCGIVVSFIVTLFKVSNIVVVLPLIIFVVVAFLHILKFVCCSYFEPNSLWEFGIDGCGILLQVIAYGWAFVVTIVYWESQRFIIRPKLLNVSQLIPFIG